MKLKLLFFIFICLAILIFFGKNLNPFSNEMFQFHDATQPARIQQFTLNLVNLKIPPRIAPDFFFKLGYPIFDFYAPTAYWITSSLNLLGFDIVNSLKLSFLIAILLAFVFSFIFLRNFFDYLPSLFGAVIYISILYLPIDIFIRGNLAEVWFITLSPLSLFFLYRNSQKPTSLSLILGSIILSLTFTCHNLLSMIFIPISLAFIFLLKNKRINFISFVLALLLSSYFLVPFFLESHLTIAREMAMRTKYQDHFLCPTQLWDSPWGYGGSIPGCNDGMSFKLGKIQIVSALIGACLFLIEFFRKKKGSFLLISVFWLLLTSISLFMTTYFSQPIWNFFSPILAVFQFPWRFITFSFFGLAYFSSYFWHKISLSPFFKNIISILIIFLIFFVNAKYFYSKPISKLSFEEKYLSEKYIEEEAAYQVPEYFSSFTYLNKIKPNALDYQVSFSQTPIEKISNLITLVAFTLLCLLFLNKSLWKKLIN